MYLLPINTTEQNFTSQIDMFVVLISVGCPAPAISEGVHVIFNGVTYVACDCNSVHPPDDKLGIKVYIVVYLQWISSVAKYPFPPKTPSKSLNYNGCHVVFDL